MRMFAPNTSARIHAYTRARHTDAFYLQNLNTEKVSRYVLCGDFEDCAFHHWEAAAAWLVPKMQQTATAASASASAAASTAVDAECEIFLVDVQEQKPMPASEFGDVHQRFPRPAMSGRVYTRRKCLRPKAVVLLAGECL